MAFSGYPKILISFKLAPDGFLDSEKVYNYGVCFGFFKYIFWVPLLLNPSIFIPPNVFTVFFDSAMICLRFLAEYLLTRFDIDLLLLGELLTDLKDGFTIV